MSYLLIVFSALIYIALFFKFGWGLALVLYGFVVAGLLAVLVIDWKTQLIPDRLNVFLALCGAASILLSPSISHVVLSVLGALLGGGLLLLLAVITKGAIGGGDIKLMFALGLLFGPADVITLMMLSFALAALVSIGLLITKKKGMKDFIPLGPAIVIAALIQLFAGNYLFTLLGY